MGSLNFNTGSITLDINGDPNRKLTFCPDDINVRSRFYEVYKDLKRGAELEALKKESEEVDTISGTNEYGVDKKSVAQAAVMDKFDKLLRAKIDYIFGDGAAQTIFGDINISSPAGGKMIVSNFLEAITPYFQNAGTSVVNKYTDRYKSPAARRKSER